MIAAYDEGKARKRRLWIGAVSFLALITLWQLYAYSKNPAYQYCTPRGTYQETDEATQVSMVWQAELKEFVVSEFQEVAVFYSEWFGHILTIDGSLMITEKDEKSYHEMIAHVPLVYKPQAERVLVIGGGDGGTCTQLLRHDNIKKVTQVEIDQVVVDMAKKYFPETSTSYSNPKLELFVQEGSKWSREHSDRRGSYDVVLVDSADFGHSRHLFTGSFYQSVKDLLKPDGILVFNADSPSWNLYNVRTSTLLLFSLFKHVFVYQSFQPTYLSGHYSFLFASDTIHPFQTEIDWEAFIAKKLDMWYYTPDTHIASFLLPKNVKDELGPASTSIADLNDANWPRSYT